MSLHQETNTYHRKLTLKSTISSSQVPVFQKSNLPTPSILEYLTITSFDHYLNTKLNRVAEASYWKSKFQGVSFSSKEFSKCMNEFTGVHKVTTISPLEDENGNINSTKEKCDM